MLGLTTIKNIREYWNGRWKAQGERGGVSPTQFVDEKYLERNNRDIERLTNVLVKAGYNLDNKFETGIECGAGAGRLSYFYNSFIKQFYCADISLEASQHFAKSNKCWEYKISPISGLKNIYPNKFDIAISFTVVQHINDKKLWCEALESIQKILKIGGIYLLHEDISANIQKRKSAPHMNERSESDYIEALDSCECLYKEVLYYPETNEYDLIAVFKRIK